MAKWSSAFHAPRAGPVIITAVVTGVLRHGDHLHELKLKSEVNRSCALNKSTQGCWWCSFAGGGLLPSCGRAREHPHG